MNQELVTLTRVSTVGPESCSYRTMHERLRSATHKLHRAVEVSIDLERRFSSKTTYREFLERLLGLHRPLEAALGSVDWSGTNIKFVERRKCAWLELDLRALGHTAQTLDAVPTADRLLRPVSIEVGLGWLYVLEGSTLGGKMLAKFARKALGLTPKTGSRYFSSYGSDTGRMWQEFLQTVNLIAPRSSEANRVESAACYLFWEFGNWLVFSDNSTKEKEESWLG